LILNTYPVRSKQLAAEASTCHRYRQTSWLPMTVRVPRLPVQWLVRICCDSSGSVKLYLNYACLFIYLVMKKQGNFIN